MLHLGDVPANSTIYIPFQTFNNAGASVTLTGLAVTDIEIYKNGSTTQRASDNGYALLDTDGIDFDGITGIHGFSVDLSDNTTAGFYSVGGFFWVVVSAVTVDAQTVNFMAATFRIVAAEAQAGHPKVDAQYVEGVDATNQIRDSVIDDATRIDASALNTAAATTIPAIDAKTTNLPSDPADASVIAGRFDTLDTSVADLPTNAELATALGTADDAILAQVALVKAKTDNLPSDPADQSLIIDATNSILTAVADVPTNAELATALASADDAVLAAIAALNDVTADDVWDEVIEGTTTARELLRGYAAALLGKGNGLDTTTARYRDLADSKNRIVATVDQYGNRSAVTLDLT